MITVAYFRLKNGNVMHGELTLPEGDNWTYEEVHKEVLDNLKSQGFAVQCLLILVK